MLCVQAVVQKLFESTKQKDELTTWCETVLKGVETTVDRQFLSCLLCSCRCRWFTVISFEVFKAL